MTEKTLNKLHVVAVEEEDVEEEEDCERREREFEVVKWGYSDPENRDRDPQGDNCQRQGEVNLSEEHHEPRLLAAIHCHSPVTVCLVGDLKHRH